MNKIINILTKNLEPKLKKMIQDRVEIMMRGIRFLKERDSKYLNFILENGWTLSKLEVICSLNSFYQFVLGPLTSSAIINIKSKIGQEKAILYGEDYRFDRKRASYIIEVNNAFKSILSNLEINFWWLQANHVEDLIYQIFKTSVSEHEDL